MDEQEESSLLVQFKIEGNVKSEIVELTYEQYSNLKELPVIIKCNIVKNKKPTLSKKDMELLTKKLEYTFANSKSHTKSLSE